MGKFTSKRVFPRYPFCVITGQPNEFSTLLTFWGKGEVNNPTGIALKV